MRIEESCPCSTGEKYGTHSEQMSEFVFRDVDIDVLSSTWFRPCKNHEKFYCNDTWEMCSTGVKDNAS